MGTSSLFATSDLMSNDSRIDPIVLPEINRITNINEYIADPDNFDGNIKTLIDRLDAESKQCEYIIILLKEEFRQKKILLEQVKEKIMELECQLELPDADQRFLVDRERILVEFSDEIEIYECDVPSALDRCSLKMSSLYGKILALDTDIHYVDYLHSVALNNRDSIEKWYETNGQRQIENGINYVEVMANVT